MKTLLSTLPLVLTALFAFGSVSCVATNTDPNKVTAEDTKKASGDLRDAAWNVKQTKNILKSF